MSHGKQVVTLHPSKKVLRKELIECCDYECYYRRRYSILNLEKIKLVANKKRMHLEISKLKGFIN